MSRTAPRVAKRPAHTSTPRVPAPRAGRGARADAADGRGGRQAPALFAGPGRAGARKRRVEVVDDAALHEVGAPKAGGGATAATAGTRPTPKGFLGAALRIGSSLPALLIAGVVLVGVLFVFVFPTSTYFEQRNRIVAAEGRLAALDAQNRSLDARAAELRTPGGVEREARERHGLTRPGEEAYMVGRPPAAPEAAPAPEPPPSWWQRLKRSVGA